MRLGDVVETVAVDGRAFMVDRVVESAGRLNLRVVVADKEKREPLHAPVLEAIAGAGCASEVFKPGYFAVDVPSAEAEESLLRALADWSSSGVLTIEKV